MILYVPRAMPTYPGNKAFLERIIFTTIVPNFGLGGQAPLDSHDGRIFRDGAFEQP